MSQPVWTCTCCSVIFAKRVDFERHRKECIKGGKTCPRCFELFTQVGLDFHLNKSICGLPKYDVKDLHTWATEVNDRRITVLVKDYHKKIMDAVDDGKFTIRLTFIYPVMYPEDSQLVRTDALSRIVSELKDLFTNVNIASSLIQNFIDVTWTESKSCYHDIPEKFLTLPELYASDAQTEAINSKSVEYIKQGKQEMREICSKAGKPGKARMGKSALIHAYMLESRGDNSTVPVAHILESRGDNSTVTVSDEKQAQEEN